MTIYNELARPIGELARRLPRIGGSYADIDEVDVLARSLVALARQSVPTRSWGDAAIDYWEERIALLLAMKEAIAILGLRQRDAIALEQLVTLTALLTPVLLHARNQRQAAKRRRTKKGLL